MRLFLIFIWFIVVLFVFLSFNSKYYLENIFENIYIVIIYIKVKCKYLLIIYISLIWDLSCIGFVLKIKVVLSKCICNVFLKILNFYFNF